MAGIIRATYLDSLRIEGPGDNRCIQIPAALLLAADRVLRHCLGNGDGLFISPPVNDWRGHRDQWAATVSDQPHLGGLGATPWEAMLRLAEALE